METIQNVFHRQTTSIVGQWRRGVQFVEEKINRLQQQLRANDQLQDENDTGVSYGIDPTSGKCFLSQSKYFSKRCPAICFRFLFGLSVEAKIYRYTICH